MLLAVAQQEDEVPTVRREAIAALVALLEDDKRKVEVSARGDRLCLGFSCSFLQLTSQLLRAQQVLAARPPVKSHTHVHMPPGSLVQLLWGLGHGKSTQCMRLHS